MAAFPPINDGEITADNLLPSLIKMLKFTNKLIELVDEPAPHWTVWALVSSRGFARGRGRAGKNKPKTA